MDLQLFRKLVFGRLSSGFQLYPPRILPLVPFAFFNGLRAKVRPGMAAVADLEFGTPVVLFVRQHRGGARGREREGQANEAARMVPVRCHEDSLTLRFRRCQIPVTFTLICFGNDLLRTFTKKVDTRIGTKNRTCRFVQIFLISWSPVLRPNQTRIGIRGLIFTGLFFGKFIPP